MPKLFGLLIARGKRYYEGLSKKHQADHQLSLYRKSIFSLAALVEEFLAHWKTMRQGRPGRFIGLLSRIHQMRYW